MPAQQSKITIKNERGIETFLLLIKQGIHSWHVAGELLDELHAKNPGIFPEIIKREPLMTVDMLETIERIGRKQLHPHLLLNSQLPIKRLIGFPYDEQFRLCCEPIDVVVSVRDGKPQVEKRMVKDCSRVELSSVLDINRVRTVEEQVKLRAKSKNEGNEAWRALSDKAAKPAPPFSSRPATPVAPAPSLLCIGRWVIRKTVGNNCGFERTSAVGTNPIRVILDGDMAVIEVCKRK